MAGDLLVKVASPQALDTFVSVLSVHLGCDRWEMRDSSSYVEGRYYRCIVLSLEVTAAIADSREFPGYDFWLSFWPNRIYLEDKAFLGGLADCVARLLALHGYQVARPLDFIRGGTDAILYRRNPIAAVGPKEQVLTEAI